MRQTPVTDPKVVTRSRKLQALALSGHLLLPRPHLPKHRGVGHLYSGITSVGGRDGGHSPAYIAPPTYQLRPKATGKLTRSLGRFSLVLKTSIP